MAQNRLFQLASKSYTAVYDANNNQVEIKANSLADKNLLIELIHDSNTPEFHIFPATSRNGLKLLISHNDYLLLKRRLSKYEDVNFKINFQEEELVSNTNKVSNSI
jgi:hypothetical protein